ncbi:hypothetical protein [Alloactinosynnema sp. L-07]|uniref:hypothetical protein n=1 Tax=Alloactinosynnema sp. L-07 TaxID=1653480 RepID=UPI0012FC272E|nr:hypothetical protein [Alloactinosynnema sp. L-07]
MTSTDAVQAVAGLTRPGGALDLGRDRARLLVRMFHLLMRGRPVTCAESLDAIAEIGLAPATAGTAARPLDRTQRRR